MTRRTTSLVRWGVLAVVGMAFGCNNNDSLSGSTGQQPEISLGCYPELGGTDESGGDPVEFQCQGVGNGWVKLTVEALAGATVVVPACLATGVGGDGDGDNPHNCPAIDFADLDELLAGDNVEHPGVCCNEYTAVEDIDAACGLDCGYAACKLTVGKLRAAAASQGSDKLKGDLNFVADKLEVPAELEKCAGEMQQALAAANGDSAWMVLDLWGGPSNTGPNHLISVELHALCSFEDPLYTVGFPTEECGVSVNTEPPAPAPVEPTIVDSNVTFYGPYGTGAAAISNVSVVFSNPGCRVAPCDFSLTRLNMDVGDVTAGSFLFEDISLSLSHDADGSITGQAVTIPAGELSFDVQFKLKINGAYLLGSNYFDFSFSTTAATTATLDVAGGFAIDRADFLLGEEHAVLNTN